MIFLFIGVAYSRVKCHPTVKRVPDELWDEIRLILPSEKPNNTIGRPAVPFRKVLDSWGWTYAVIDKQSGKVASAKNPRKWGKLSTFVLHIKTSRLHSTSPKNGWFANLGSIMLVTSNITVTSKY